MNEEEIEVGDLINIISMGIESRWDNCLLLGWPEKENPYLRVKTRQGKILYFHPSTVGLGLRAKSIA